jgi:predicted nucleotide-binding protein (sugar kinase/HSP70/actin superfamily)
MTTQHFEKRFGMTAVEKGFVRPEQVFEAIEIQVKENMKQKKHRFIGVILVEQGYMRHSQIQEVLESMDVPEGLSDKNDAVI